MLYNDLNCSTIMVAVIFEIISTDSFSLPSINIVRKLKMSNFNCMMISSAGKLLMDTILFCLKGNDVNSVSLADIGKVRHISANRSRRINPRVHLHHKLFTFSKFCFLKIVQGCQIGKVLASFSRTEKSEQTTWS